MGNEKLLKWEDEREEKKREKRGRGRGRGIRWKEEGKREGREKSRRWMEWKIIIVIMGGMDDLPVGPKRGRGPVE